MSMTKADLVGIVSKQCPLNGNESAKIVELFFQILKETLERGENVKISRFGNFITHEKKPRKGRNPQTGGELVISARRVLTFKPSAILRKAVNQGASFPSPSGALEEGSNEIENL